MAMWHPDWRKDKKFLASTAFIAVVITTASYSILAEQVGDEIANMFVDNCAGFYRVLFPAAFMLENPREILQAVKFILCLTFNLLGIGLSMLLWETRRKK
jgi:hypothetical protein